MAVEVKRKPNETVEGLIRRFSQRVLQSRVVFKAKAAQFRVKPKTKQQVKQEALRRKYVRAKRAYLQRIGQLPDDSQVGGQNNYQRHGQNNYQRKR